MACVDLEGGERQYASEGAEGKVSLNVYILELE